jgi:hypothetical protein
LLPTRVVWYVTLRVLLFFQADKLRRGAKQAVVAHVYAENKGQEAGGQEAGGAVKELAAGGKRGGSGWQLPTPSDGGGALAQLPGHAASAALQVGPRKPAPVFAH